MFSVSFLDHCPTQVNVTHLGVCVQHVPVKSQATPKGQHLELSSVPYLTWGWGGEHSGMYHNRTENLVEKTGFLNIKRMGF